MTELNFKAIKTAGLDRAAWLKERKNGIGGSDVAAALGISPWKTPLQLFEEKTGKAEPAPAGEAAYWGTTLEEVVAKEFSKRTGMKVQRVNFTLCRGQGLWMRANLDRAIVRPSISGIVKTLSDEDAAASGRLISTDAILECKTASVYLSDQWGDSQLDEIRSGDVKSEHKIPLFYETQVQWYLAVTGCAVAYVAVLLGGQDFRVYEVRRNEAVIKAITEKCEAFWSENVLKGVPPAAVDSADIKRLYEKDDGELREATNAEAADIGELRTLKERIKKLKDEEAAVAERVILAVAEKAGLTIGGEKAVTYKAVTSTRFDSRTFKKDCPKEYAEYSTTSTTRTLRLA